MRNTREALKQVLSPHISEDGNRARCRRYREEKGALQSVQKRSWHPRWSRVEELSKGREEGKADRRALTRFTLGELMLLLLSFPLPVSCSFTVTSCQPENTQRTEIPQRHSSRAGAPAAGSEPPPAHTHSQFFKQWLFPHMTAWPHYSHWGIVKVHHTTDRLPRSCSSFIYFPYLLIPFEAGQGLVPREWAWKLDHSRLFFISIFG